MTDYEISPQYVRLAKMIADLMQQQFYGSVEIKFQAGQIAIINKMESLKV